MMKKCAEIILNPDSSYSVEARKWQGVPSMEITGNPSVKEELTRNFAFAI